MNFDFFYMLGFLLVPMLVSSAVYFAMRKRPSRACAVAGLLGFAICTASAAGQVHVERIMAGFVCATIFTGIYFIKRQKQTPTA